MTVFSICKVILTSPMSEASQSLLLFVSGTRSLVAAACGIEVIGHGERDAAREIVSILSADDISTIIRPPLTIALGPFLFINPFLIIKVLMVKKG